MCVETLRTVLIFPRQLIWGVTYLGLVEKWMFSHLSPQKSHKCVCWNPQNRARFSKTIDLRGYMPRFTLKMNIFPSISLRNPINVCWNPQNRDHFSKTIDLRGHMPRFTLKMNVFPSISLRNPINVCWNPQNRARFSKTIDLRGHMPRFSWKMNVFPSISSEIP